MKKYEPFITDDFYPKFHQMDTDTLHITVCPHIQTTLADGRFLMYTGHVQGTDDMVYRAPSGEYRLTKDHYYDAQDGHLLDKEIAAMHRLWFERWPYGDVMESWFEEHYGQTMLHIRYADGTFFRYTYTWEAA